MPVGIGVVAVHRPEDAIATDVPLHRAAREETRIAAVVPHPLVQAADIAHQSGTLIGDIQHPAFQDDPIAVVDAAGILHLHGIPGILRRYALGYRHGDLAHEALHENRIGFLGAGSLFGVVHLDLHQRGSRSGGALAVRTGLVRQRGVRHEETAVIVPGYRNESVRGFLHPGPQSLNRTGPFAENRTAVPHQHAIVTDRENTVRIDDSQRIQTDAVRDGRSLHDIARGPRDLLVAIIDRPARHIQLISLQECGIRLFGSSEKGDQRLVYLVFVGLSVVVTIIRPGESRGGRHVDRHFHVSVHDLLPRFFRRVAGISVVAGAGGEEQCHRQHRPSDFRTVCFHKCKC